MISRGHMTNMYTDNSCDTDNKYTRGFFSIQVSWFSTKTQTYKKRSDIKIEAIFKSNLITVRM